MRLNFYLFSGILSKRGINIKKRSDLEITAFSLDHNFHILLYLKSSVRLRSRIAE